MVMEMPPFMGPKRGMIWMDKYNVWWVWRGFIKFFLGRKDLKNVFKQISCAKRTYKRFTQAVQPTIQ